MFLVVGFLAAVPAITPPLERDTADYWQQEVHYVIQASLDEPSGVLAGREAIAYVNHSPDTLTEFYLHLYLNAFRPGSRWADRDSIEGRRRFNDLGDPDYGFERIARSAIGGVPVSPQFPYAPDSTIVRFALPAALAPGEGLDLTIEWRARPSTVPRRQGRRGRRFDFAQWYPRVVVYDRGGWQDHPLYPAGEFYGEFGSYDVTLDVADDQVIGATGIALEGDPGWEGAKARRGLVVDYQRDWYAASSRPARGSAARATGCASAVPGPGRKCVRFYAEDVHHFAMSLNPEYRYEQGRFGDVVVRALYLAEDVGTWGNGIAVGRTVEALRWLDELFGPYPWPQITNVHRIEGGGTEFPMMVMNGGAGLGLILHEVGHNYVMGVLGNNEWKEGYLDEGFTSFQTSWYFEDHAPGFDAYARLEPFILELDLDGWSQPVSTVSEAFRDFTTYGLMIYSKAELFYHQLRYVVGDEMMRAILREYYRRWKLKHVTEEALRGVAEAVSGMDLSWLFSQWLHGTPLYDYALGDVTRRRLAVGGWETTVEVERKAAGRMPVEIGEHTGRGVTIHARTAGERHETVSFQTLERPGALMLDPRVRTHDWNFLNNREGRLPIVGHSRWRLDDFFREPQERDRLVASLAPTFWWNDASDGTVGLRFRQNYLGRYNRVTLWLGRGVSGVETATLGESVDFYAKLENPVWLRRANTTQSVEGWAREGTVGARVRYATEHRASLASDNVYRKGYSAQWVATREALFLDPRLWDNAGTVELARFDDWDLDDSRAHWRVRLDYGGGMVYAFADPQTVDDRYDTQLFGRATASASVRKPVAGFVAGARAFAGGYLGDANPVAQRAIPLHGADPYQTLGNPFLRTQGALLRSPARRSPFTDRSYDVFYHAPGNANLRGYRPSLGGRWVIGGTVEIERDVYRGSNGLLRRASIVAFGDGALVDTLAVSSGTDRAYTPVYDAGGGVRVWFRIGDLTFPVRVEFPVYVSEPFFAYDTREGSQDVQFRWLISLQPIF